MTGMVLTTGDPEKMIWVLRQLDDGRYLCLAQFGKVKNRPVLKAFLTRLTKNTHRVEVDADQAQEFKKRCTRHLTEVLNDRISRPSVRKELLREWLQHAVIKT